MKEKTFFGAVAVAVLLLSVGGWFALFDGSAQGGSGSGGGGGSGGDGSSGEYVIDAAGRQVVIPESLDGGIVTVGSIGPLRFLSIFGLQYKVIEVDDGDATDPKNGRGYSYAYDFSNVATHPDNVLSKETVESIALKHPSLVLIQKSVYDGYKDLAEDLNRAVPVVVVHAQSTSDFFTEDLQVAEWYADCITMLGKVLDMEYTASEHLCKLESLFKDIRSLCTGEPGVTYVAGVTFSGSNQLNTTFPTYLPLNLTLGSNAYTGGSTANKIDLTVEEAVEYIKTADRIVVDPSSADKLKENNSQLILEELYRLNNDSDPDNDIPIYAGIPIVWDNMNYDCVVACAYYMAYLQYGTLTMDELNERIQNTFQTFYRDAGTHVFERMCDFFEEKCAMNGCDMPLLSELKVEYNNGAYTLVPAQEA